MPREINSVAIVGGGFMGAGIAEVSAVAGMPVVVRDLPQFLDAARGRVEKSLAGAVKRGKIDLVKRDEVLARITFTPNPKNGPQLGARQRTPTITGRPGSAGALWVRRFGCSRFRPARVRVRGCGRG